MQMLAAQGDEDSLELMCQLLRRNLLVDDHSVAIALSPLFQWPPPALATVFEHLKEDLWSWQLLAPMLDLAGHSVRRGKLKQHPLEGQKARLRELLSGTVQRLARLEEDPKHFGEDVESIQRVLNNAIVLTVTLCDTLGLVGDQEAEGKLNQAMGLSHRRVQTEAAGALARLGKSDGKKRLIELISDPMSRLRAIAYADELGMDSEVPAEYRSPQARAEAEALLWLSDPQRFGVGPQEFTLVDERTQLWPGHDEPQTCFVWKFTYQFSNGDISNLIMSGPFVHAFQADLRGLELDEVYAIFAGWYAEHDEIYEVPAAHFNSAQRIEADRLLKKIGEQGIESPRALALTFFFGERAILALGDKAGQTVCAISDDLETIIKPIHQSPTSLTPDLVLALYRGNKLLRTFN